MPNARRWNFEGNRKIQSYVVIAQSGQHPLESESDLRDVLADHARPLLAYIAAVVPLPLPERKGDLFELREKQGIYNARWMMKNVTDILVRYRKIGSERV